MAAATGKHDGPSRPPGSWFPTQIFPVLLGTPVPTICYCHVHFLCIFLINLHEIREFTLDLFLFSVFNSSIKFPLNKETTALT